LRSYRVLPPNLGQQALLLYGGKARDSGLHRKPPSYVAKYEHSNWSAWLEQTGNEAELLRALPAGSLNVEQVR
jgi:hypothetical protein